MTISGSRLGWMEQRFLFGFDYQTKPERLENVSGRSDLFGTASTFCMDGRMATANRKGILGFGFSSEWRLGSIRELNDGTGYASWDMADGFTEYVSRVWIWVMYLRIMVMGSWATQVFRR